MKKIVSLYKKYEEIIKEINYFKPYYLDADPVYLAVFLYLKEKYGTIENYNKINGTNHNGFSKIQFPTSGLSSRLIMESYDYCNFADTVGKEWIKLMSMSVKAVSDKPVHVKQMEYVTAYDEGDARWLIAIGFDPQEYNRYLDLNGNDAELRIENDEVITTVSQYVEGKALAQSMWYDFQLSMKEAPVINSEDHILANGDKTYTKDHKKLTNVAQWMGAIHGRSMAATWIFDRTQTRPETYESIMYRPDLYENVSEINMDWIRERYSEWEKERKDKTIILVSHRKSTMSVADEVIAM